MLSITCGDPFGKGRDEYRFGVSGMDDGEEPDSQRPLGEGHRQDEEPDDEEGSLQGEGDEMMLRDTYGMLYRIETENLEKGRAREKRQIAIKMLRKESYALSEIAELTDIPVEVEKIAKGIRQEG